MPLERTDPGGKEVNEQMLPESTGQGVQAERAPGACMLGGGGEQARGDSALTGGPGGERPFAVKR